MMMKKAASSVVAVVVVLLLPVVVQLVVSDGNNSIITHPIVTLFHGGQVKGAQATIEGYTVAMFAGIPFAAPPVDELRFKKPKPALPWEGVMDGSVNKMLMCPQMGAFGKFVGHYMGQEDCLVLDVYVPGGLIPSIEKKAVMVWIHGGAYVMGSGTWFPMTLLAGQGDVIIVTINYRLGALGFISEGEGTGNFALWDQRQALVWVQENIEQFGGDSSRVTIFGESAGGGSVSALTMSAHTEGLFHRAIPQSGSLYAPWSWSHSEMKRVKVNILLISKFNCSDDGIYKCLSNVPADDIIRLVTDPTILPQPFHPYRDDDFFLPEVDEQTYKASQRFDLMQGFTSQEGLIIAAFIGNLMLAPYNKTIEEHGMPAEAMSQLLFHTCTQIDSFAPELCVNYLSELYNIGDVENDKKRLSHYVDLATDHNFGAESWKALEHHAGGDKSTYGYSFTEPWTGKGLWSVPSWLKTGADHSDDIFFMLGGAKMSRSLKDQEKAFYGEFSDRTFADATAGADSDDKLIQFAENIMRYWTNFAKSGNPNKPVSVKDCPPWPQYTQAKQNMMQLQTTPSVVSVPRLQKLQALDSNIFSIQRRQHAAELVLPSAPVVSILSVVELTITQASQVIIALTSVTLVLLIYQMFC